MKIYDNQVFGKLNAERYTVLYNKYQEEQNTLKQRVRDFVDKVIVYERDRKCSTQTTQKLEIYFNFIGKYKPYTMKEPELTLVIDFPDTYKCTGETDIDKTYEMLKSYVI